MLPLSRAAADKIGYDPARTFQAGLDSDTITGGGLNDLVYGGPGNDRLYGNNGDDFLLGGEGHDWLIGAKGSDILYAGNGLAGVSASENNGHLHLTALRWSRQRLAPTLPIPLRDSRHVSVRTAVGR